MDNEEAQAGFEELDADAVCASCGTVNPEGSLLCKTCGNNLRDQRRERIAQDQSLAAIGAGPSRFRIFTGVLTMLGIVTVLVAASSVQNIEAWLVSIQGSPESGAVEDLWTGEASGLYDDLLRELDESPSSRAAINESLQDPVYDNSFNGRYALVRMNDVLGASILGEANLRREGDRVRFVARLGGRGIDVRGFADLEADEDGILNAVAWNSAGVRIDGAFHRAQGYTEKQADGGYTCYGQSFFNDNAYYVSAYRLR